MEYNDLKNKIDNAIKMLHVEGSIIVPMNEEQYEVSKNYMFCIINDEKDLDWQVQMRLYEIIRTELISRGTKISSIPDEGLIRLK